MYVGILCIKHEAYINRNRQTDKQETDRQIERKTDRETNMQVDRLPVCK